MGFQNRYVNENLISTYLKLDRSLKYIFKSETLVLEDKISSLVYELHLNGVSDDEIQKTIFKQLKNMEEKIL
jgi:hypothetical protein